MVLDGLGGSFISGAQLDCSNNKLNVLGYKISVQEEGIPKGYILFLFFIIPRERG